MPNRLALQETKLKLAGAPLKLTKKTFLFTTSVAHSGSCA
jgi:hypothetical protein